MLASMTSPHPQAAPEEPAFATDEARYAAVRRRDPAADGVFVYAVRTTGVFCRPTCAARPARVENISFHASGAAAARAGFRACLRCRPTDASPAERHAALVAAACRQIETSETPPVLAVRAATAGLGPQAFQRMFKTVTGVTPKEFAGASRAARAAAGLVAGASVTAALYEAGYNAPSRFYADVPARLGMSPSALRRGGAGTRIRFAIGACSLGAILVAATGRGVCAVLLGDDPDRLLRDLQDRFSRAELVGGDAAFESTVAAAVGLIEAPGRAFPLPLDIGGTLFQQKVWRALQAIPAGWTASYAEVATRIGHPAAVRAVAAACAANPLAVAIPCHRVVRNDGALSGYRWGVERKRALLAREAAAAGD